MTINQAQQWLKDNPYGKLRAIYDCPVYGKRQATICNGQSFTIALKPKSKKRGHMLVWDRVESIWEENKKLNDNQTPKYILKAKKASFSNSYITKCLNADPSKSPYENRLTTGVPIEGKIITLKSFGKYYPHIEHDFRMHLANKQPYTSARVPFRGYEAHLSLWFEDDTKTSLCGGLSLEYKNCGNGYYYLLINDEEFIGYDID